MAKSTSALLPPDTEGGHKKDANSLPGGNASQSIHSLQVENYTLP